MANLSIRIIFFGSTLDSLIVLEKLRQCQLSNITLSICCIVTQPARPVGRKQTRTATPVEIWAKKQGIAVVTFPSNPEKPWLYTDEETVIDTLQPFKADLLVSACYGQKIPWDAIRQARFGGLNIHPSLLPRWRGADPVPWAILSGDRQTGVTVVTLSENFDEGAIIAQKKVPITDTDTSDSLRTNLFTLGTDLLIKAIPEFLSTKHEKKSSLPSPHSSLSTPYARRLTRDDGFEPWGSIHKAFDDAEEARRIERKFRAFSPWPGVWTLLRQGYGGQAKKRRLKILSLRLHPTPFNLQLDTVQLEGKKPVLWKQFLSAYPLFPT